MDWFSAGSLRTQWRLAQALLAIPVGGFAVFLLLMVGMLFVDPSWSAEMARFIVTNPLRLVGPVACLALVLAIERHLAAKAPPVPHST